MNIVVQIHSDTATPALRALRAGLTPPRLAQELGPRCAKLVQDNFRSLGPNKKGWPTTNFWNRAAAATTWLEGRGYVIIRVNQVGVRQRLMGGDIYPVTAHALTIPASAEAYGRSARDFSGLKSKLVLDPERGTLRMALVQPGGSELPLFWLAGHVWQDKDPKVLPADEVFAKEFDKSVEVLLSDDGGGN